MEARGRYFERAHADGFGFLPAGGVPETVVLAAHPLEELLGRRVPVKTVGVGDKEAAHRQRIEPEAVEAGRVAKDGHERDRIGFDLPGDGASDLFEAVSGVEAHVHLHTVFGKEGLDRPVGTQALRQDELSRMHLAAAAGSVVRHRLQEKGMAQVRAQQFHQLLGRSPGRNVHGQSFLRSLQTGAEDGAQHPCGGADDSQCDYGQKYLDGALSFSW